MNLTDIISEADLLVPNEVPTADKIIALNSINQDFFNTVKIPRVIPFTPVLDQASYVLSNEIRLKNIDLVMVGIIKYHELIPGTTNPLQNTYAFDDTTYTLTLRPAPYATGLQGVLRYARRATTTFVSGNLSAVPDAPEEYHWTYYAALAAYLADAMDDPSKAESYESQYRTAWQQAAQQYAGVTANG